MSECEYESHHVTCDLGHRHWGPAGAAGLCVYYDDADGERWYLLQQRSEWVQFPGTWAVPGGAIDRDETPLSAAVREFQEEVRSKLPWFDADVTGTAVDDHGGWTYTTFFVRVPRPFRARPADGETGKHGLMWVRLADMLTLDLHPGVREVFEEL